MSRSEVADSWKCVSIANTVPDASDPEISELWELGPQSSILNGMEDVIRSPAPASEPWEGPEVIISSFVTGLWS
jgi:hypothetical protein